jgi:LysM repeat protein
MVGWLEDRSPNLPIYHPSNLPIFQFSGIISLVMGEPRKRINYLDYPLFPTRQRPWRRLILAGVLLGMLAYVGWGWLGRTGLTSGLLSRLPHRSGVPLPGELPVSDGALAAGGTSAFSGGQVMLARSQVITPAATLPPDLTLPPVPTDADLIDEVDEVEVPWADHEGREEIVTYPVQVGDTLWNIALEFDLDVDTLRWSNPDLERNPDMLPVGMELAVLPMPGVYHTVQAGETVSGIAQRYGVAEADILNYPLNHLASPAGLQVGQRLVIPHGHKELARPTPQPSPESPFAWPLVGRITQPFRDEHRAIDIGAPYGSPVYAGRAGTVIRSGWARTGYGYTVIIDHGQGLVSLYSHMKGQWVRVGDWVERGQLIGEVGSTGNSSGPHVHFEVRVDGERVNPLDYLPPGEPR